jgi:hypothetical protein
MKVIRNCCWRAECPICYEKWASREAKRADERIKNVETLYKLNGTPLGPIRHFVLSPPQDKAKELIKTKKGYKKLKGWLDKALKKGGLTGYLPVFHSHRQRKKPRSRSYYLKYKNEKKFDVIKRNGKEIYMEHTGIWYISPHFHILGYGYLENAKYFQKDTGWVYKNKGIRDSVYNTIQYLLSHCGIATEQENHDGRPFQVVNWFGALSSYYVHIAKKEVEMHDIKCGICGEQMHEFKKIDDDLPIVQINDDGTMDWSNAEDMGVYTYKTTKITYGLAHLEQLNEKYEVGDSGFLRWRSKKKKHRKKWKGGISE